eukprot:TRINITY_DN8106_c0_g1_i1.p1 TRINITY_DN8106_c0_g1~~TRINITY_DN8106_c0_g1_i1.p1  ORF type:complete len:198 (+),score=10.44 TRINITY_DN8106_c0_g1_i1:314-907(+)
MACWHIFASESATKKIKKSLSKSATAFERCLTDKSCKGFLTLMEAKVEKLETFDRHKNVISITTSYKRQFYAEVSSSTECDEWIEALSGCIRQSLQPLSADIKKKNLSARRVGAQVSVPSRRMKALMICLSKYYRNCQKRNMLQKMIYPVHQPTQAIQHTPSNTRQNSALPTTPEEVCVPSWDVTRVSLWLSYLGKL